MKIKVKSYHCPPHKVKGHHVSGYMRKVPGTNRRIHISGHKRVGHHQVGHIVPMYVRSKV